MQGDAQALVLEQQAAVASRQVAQHVAGVLQVGVGLGAIDAVDAAPHQAVHGGQRRHAAFQDAVQVFERAAADHRHAPFQGARQLVQQRRAARVGPDLFGPGR